MRTYHFTEAQLRKMLLETISMYEEYLVKHGSPKASAHLKATQEMVEGLDAEQELVAYGQLERVAAGQIIIPNQAQQVILKWLAMNGIEA